MRSQIGTAMAALVLLCVAEAAVVINELMFNAKQGAGYEYIEIHNDALEAVDISSFHFTEGITFTFPTNSVLAADGYVVVAANVTTFLSVYSYLDSNLVFGPYEGKLDNSDEKIELSDANGTSIHKFKYRDSWPSAALSNGFGSSLELICPSADPSEGNSWRSSPAPFQSDKFVEFGGSPGKTNSWTACPAPTNIQIPNILVSEIMFQPHNEQSRIERHEFIEFYNGETSSIDLSGYRLVSSSKNTDSLRFTFPTGSVVPAETYFLVVKDKSAISSVYKLNSTTPIFGNYSGELKNGGDLVVMVDSNGLLVTTIEYDNNFPWPAAAHGGGSVKYQGYSLERISLYTPPERTYNWAASLPTPGRQNRANRDSPQPMVVQLEVFQADVDCLVAFTPTTVKAKISPNEVTAVYIRYYIDDINREDEPKLTGNFTNNGNDSNIWEFTFLDFLPNSIVRFVILADTPDKNYTQLYPRASDPFKTHNIFISPRDDPSEYHLFIRNDRWTKLWNNLNNGTEGGLYDDGLAGCCELNERWNDGQKAILGYRGVAYDVEMRYQGSYYNRFRGFNFDEWNDPPSAPDPVISLSLKVTLPDYVKIDSRKELYFIKPNDYGCSFISAHTTFDLARQLGLFTPISRFAKVFVNSQYYNYAHDLVYYSSDLIEDYIEEVYDEQCQHQTSEQVGVIYKAKGFVDCKGPIGASDESYQQAVVCPKRKWTTEDRIANAYSMDTQKSWASYSELVHLTDVLGKGPNALDFSEPVKASSRAWLEQNFDVNLMLSYLVLVNWAGAWDDLTVNHMLYRRLSDGKWHMTIWDTDNLWGRAMPCRDDPGCSLYLGEYGQEVGEWQKPGSGNNLKNAFIKTFRSELEERYRVLAKTVLSVENVNAAVDRAAADFNMLAAMELSATFAPPRLQLDGNCVPNMKMWHLFRNKYVQLTLGTDTNTTLSVCPDKPAVQKVITSYEVQPGTPSAPVAYMKDSKVRVRWSPPNNWGNPITSYTVQKNDGNGSWTEVYEGSDTRFKDEQVVSSATYRVQASNAKGSSTWSPASAVILTSSPTSGNNEWLGTDGVLPGGQGADDDDSGFDDDGQHGEDDDDDSHQSINFVTENVATPAVGAIYLIILAVVAAPILLRRNARAAYNIV